MGRHFGDLPYLDSCETNVNVDRFELAPQFRDRLRYPLPRRRRPRFCWSTIKRVL